MMYFNCHCLFRFFNKQLEKEELQKLSLQNRQRILAYILLLGATNFNLMQSSSDCLFHFVATHDKIKSILSDKLYGSRCKETLNYDGELTPLYVPMISFCDMQLSTYVDLGTAYGKYGIGLSKKWAIANKLNPVTFPDESLLCPVRKPGLIDLPKPVTPQAAFTT